MPEKRKTRRIAPSEMLAVKDPQTRVTLGFLRDISVGGILLEGQGPFTLNKLTRVKIVFPFRIMGERHLELDAICRWRTKTPSRGVLSAGFEFVNTTPDQELAINLLQAEYLVRALPAAGISTK